MSSCYRYLVCVYSRYRFYKIFIIECSFYLSVIFVFSTQILLTILYVPVPGENGKRVNLENNEEIILIRFHL